MLNSTLIFVDDLMLFCKRDIISINKIMEGIKHFSDVTGLVANQEKSSIYLAGVGEVLQQKIIDSIGFTKGSLPIRYLGLPLSS